VGTHEPSTVIAVEPLVVVVEAGASVEAGVLRHAARLHRARPNPGTGPDLEKRDTRNWAARGLTGHRAAQR